MEMRKGALRPVVTARCCGGEDKDEPVSPTARIFHEPHFNFYILCMMGFGKRIDVDVFKAGLQTTLVRHPRFSSIQVFDDGGKDCGGVLRWVPTEVNIDDHLVVPDLDPASIPSPDRFVDDYISDLSTTSLDLSSPLWEIHLLNLPTSEAKATAVFRIHHSIGDGLSLVSLLLSCTRKTSDPDALPTIPKPSGAGKRSEEKRNGWGNVLTGVLALVVGLVRGMRVAWNTAVDVAMFLATSLFLRDSDTPIKGREGVEFNKKRFVHATVSLEDLKVIKRSVDGTINDVLLGAFSAGVTRYLSRRYGDVTSKGGIPTDVRMRCALFVNIRKSPGIHALADMIKGNKSTARWGNAIGYVLFRLPTMLHGNPLDYVKVAKDIGDRKKSSLEALFSFSCAHLILKLFGIKLAAALSYRVFDNTTTSFSNVAGPVDEISFCDHPIVYIAPTVYGHPHALTAHFLSYMNTMKIILAVDESVIPDPYQLCEDIVESVNAIKNASDSKGPSYLAKGTGKE